MAVQIFYPVIPASLGTASNTIYSATLGAAANSGVINTGPDMIIRVAASGPITIRFGAAATITAATASDMYIPSGVVQIFDMGHLNNAIWIFSVNAATSVTVSTISKN